MHLFPFLSDSPNPRSTVLLAHGFGEHHGRYSRFIKELNDASYDVWTFDFPGHGTAKGPRGRVDVSSLIVEHLDVRRQLRNRSRTENSSLFGHSMGGLVTLASALLDPSDLSAVAVTGPALLPLPAVAGPVQGLAALASGMLPAFPTAPLDRGALSRDPQVQLDLEADPHAFVGRVPLLTAASMVQQGKRVLENAQMLSVPTLIVHGGEDSLADVAGSAEFVSSAPGNAELIVVEGAFHEVLNELERDETAREIIQWFDRW